MKITSEEVLQSMEVYRHIRDGNLQNAFLRPGFSYTSELLRGNEVYMSAIAHGVDYHEAIALAVADHINTGDILENGTSPETDIIVKEEVENDDLYSVAT